MQESLVALGVVVLFIFCAIYVVLEVIHFLIAAIFSKRRRNF
jgi:hypothetical protein